MRYYISAIILVSLTLCQFVWAVKPVITQLAIKPSTTGTVVLMQYQGQVGRPTVHTRGQQIILVFHHTRLATLWRQPIPWQGKVQHLQGQQQGDNTQLILTLKQPMKLHLHQHDQCWLLSLQTPQSVSGLVTLNVQQADLAKVISTLAAYSHQSLVLSPEVKGNITVHLHNVPWHKALQTVLLSHDLLMAEDNNVLYIGPVDSVLKHLKDWHQASEQQAALAALQSAILPLHYAKAQVLATQLNKGAVKLLSKRGQAAIDQRTNTLLIRDIPARLHVIEDWVHHVDRPVSQVHIKARIVLVNESAVKEFGALLNQRGEASGGFGSIGKLAVNTPLLDPAGALGMSLGTLPGGAWLDWELQALSAAGQGEVIASPSLTVSNRQSASIEQGDDVPYQVSAGSSGATAVQFKKAVLGLSVTPQVTAGHNVVLALQVNKDSVTRNKGAAGDVPIVATSVIKTTVQVASGQTIVLGGIKLLQHRQDNRTIPGLGKLPVIGALFSHRADDLAHSELLIFITPTIIKR